MGRGWKGQAKKGKGLMDTDNSVVGDCGRRGGGRWKRALGG